MDTRTGELLTKEQMAAKLAALERDIPTVEDVQALLEADPEAPIPDVVAVPPSYLPLTPQQRLAMAFGATRGKDRSRSRTPKKSDRQRRYERAEARRAKKERK